MILGALNYRNVTCTRTPSRRKTYVAGNSNLANCFGCSARPHRVTPETMPSTGAACEKLRLLALRVENANSGDRA